MSDRGYWSVISLGRRKLIDGVDVPDARFAFLNCYNLFPVDTVQRNGAPLTPRELREKTRHLAATLRHLFSDGSPDLIGLVEVGNITLGRDVAARISNKAYGEVWSGAPRGQTGLLLLYNTAAFAALQPPVLAETGVTERVRWMAVPMQPLRGSRAPFWFVVNHWKSRLGGEEQTRRDRHRTAREIGAFFARAREISDAMLMVGDFNCEPWDTAFRIRSLGGTGSSWDCIQAVRERALVLSDQTRYPYFYNPMWRWVGEPDPHENAIAPGYVQPRVIGTHGNLARRRNWVMFDQILASKVLLRGPLIRILEGAVDIRLPEWGCSDHCAVGGRLWY